MQLTSIFHFVLGDFLAATCAAHVHGPITNVGEEQSLRVFEGFFCFVLQTILQKTDPTAPIDQG